MPDPVLSTRALGRATLARQMLLARERTTVRKAIERLVAMQAQVPKPPFLGLWTRLDGFEREHLLKEVHGRTVVRATTLRGTLHLMTAADFLAFRGTIQPALDRGLQSALGKRIAGLDLDALQATARAFFRRGPATFDALREHLQAANPKGDARALAYAVRCRLPLVQVPDQTTWGWPASADFTLADAWLDAPMPTETTPAETLVLRYLAAFGPATPGDAQTWSYLQGLKDAFEALRPKLVTFRDSRKRELFDLPKAPRPDEDTPAPVRFLPEYDNLVLSHQDRTRIVADKYKAALVSKNLQVRATFLLDGIVAGTWRIERKKSAATLSLEPFANLGKKEKAAFEEEGEALLRFAEPDATQRAVRASARR